MRLLPVIGLLLLCAGCATPRHYAYVFPAGYEDQCAAAVEITRPNGYEQCGNYTIKLHPCENQIDGVWAWQWNDGTRDMWIGGITWGRRRSYAVSEIATSPDGVLEAGCLLHECLHFWYGVNDGDWGHNRFPEGWR